MLRAIPPAIFAATIALVTQAKPASAQIEAQVFFGSAANAPLPISISQSGFPDLNFTAHWETRPTRPAWYYAWRVGYWSGNRGWRLDHTHHKIYLTNPPPEVQELRVTNGFNIVSLSRSFRSRRLTYSVGAGPVIAYTYNTVRDRPYLNDRGWNGYTLAGGTLIGMVTREVPLFYRFVLSLDGRLSASYARVPVADGHAEIPNAAVHFHVGVGYAIGERPRP